MANVGFSPVPPDALQESKRPSNGGELNGNTEWTAERGAARYQIHGWGAPYFHVNARGHVEVRPNPDRPERVINLFELAQELKARGLDLPLLIRFSDIVADRIKRINEAFLKAITEYEYPGIYRGVYPVKVNQQRHLVEEIVEAGRAYSFGLEAGSKPELLIALAAMQDVGGLIICNGYKDSKYIETALVAQKFDKTVIIVLERLEEIDLVFRASEKLGIRPLLGVRAKLTTKGVGRWKDSAGERAKFGLPTSEMIEVVDRLTARNMLDSLQLLHFHIGSQISSIIPIKNAMQEASNIYVELAKMGCKMGYLDVGGGLAVDYDGSKTDFHASKNYQLEEYAADVVAHIQAACVKAEISVPTIVSESGRAWRRTTRCWCSRWWAKTRCAFRNRRSRKRTPIACCVSFTTPIAAFSPKTCRKATTTPVRPKKRRRAFSSTATSRCASAHKSRRCSGTAARRSTTP